MTESTIVSIDDLDTEPQDITKPLTRAAAFLVLTINDGDEAMAKARDVVGSTGDLIKDVRIRSLTGKFSANVGIGHRVWTRLTGRQPPKELQPFDEIRGDKHTAVATPGDLLYHLRAETTDLIIEFEKLLLRAFGDAVAVADDVSGFRYFDDRDLLEFIDGTANAVGLAAIRDTVVGTEDPDYVGGSYVVVQKYLHDIDAWRAAGTGTQEDIMGRTKFDNVELPDATGDAQKSHKTLCTIKDSDGEHDILRDNMPFAAPGKNEWGTYFIGYSRHLWVINKMLERMFIGDPPGKYDRILDFSHAVTGCTFFAPPRQFVKNLAG